MASEDDDSLIASWPESSQSEYFKSLTDKKDKIAYTKKLTLNSGNLLPDPWAVENEKWKQDETLMPDIYADIVFYLLETPSEYTKDKIRCYKSLEAWHFFICGHVQDIFIYSSKETYDFIFIKTSVLPSQRQGQKEGLYDTWCVLNKAGWILAGNCTCMAG